MRLQRLCLLAAFAPLLCITCHGQSQFDGDFWVPKSKDLKILYVVGFVDGRNDGINDAAKALGTDIYNPKISKLASNVTVGQIVDGLDEFYKDWRNRKILLRHAMEYVQDEAQGKDDSDLLRFLRQTDSTADQRQ
jgi:hypothetical protein